MSFVCIFLRYGSLIIDYEIIGNTNDSNDFKLELAQCMSQLMSGGTNTTVLYQLPLVLSITIKDKNGNPQSCKTENIMNPHFDQEQ